MVGTQVPVGAADSPPGCIERACRSVNHAAALLLSEAGDQSDIDQLGRSAPSYSAARGAGLSQPARSANARRDSARLRARPFSLPRMRAPSSSISGVSISGNSPKFTFIGWKARLAPAPSARCPPVMCPSSAPKAVVCGGGIIFSPRASAAANLPARSPIAALSRYPSTPVTCPAKRKDGRAFS